MMDAAAETLTTKGDHWKQVVAQDWVTWPAEQAACRKTRPGTLSKMSDARPREAEPLHTQRGGWMRHPAAADEPRRRYRTKSYCDAPRTMKMGTIASPWPMMPRPAMRSNR